VCIRYSGCKDRTLFAACDGCTASRLSRGARRGSPDPAGLPDRQVSRAHRRPRFQRCSCLLSLVLTKDTYRSSIWAGSGDPRPARDCAWGGVRRPAPSAGSCLGRGQESLPLPVLPGKRDLVRVHTNQIPSQETRALAGALQVGVQQTTAQHQNAPARVPTNQSPRWRATLAGASG
jgi:hypothetical protein